MRGVERLSSRTGFLNSRSCCTYSFVSQIIERVLIVLDNDKYETKMFSYPMRRIVPLPPFPDAYGGYRSLLDSFLEFENEFPCRGETRKLVFLPLIRDLLEIEYNFFCLRTLKKLSAK